MYTAREHASSTCNITNCLKQLINADVQNAPSSKCETEIINYNDLDKNYILLSPNFPKLEGEQVIYMEVEKYNTYDEICPFPTQTNSMFSNTYCGRVNSAFAKIPLLNGPSPDGSRTFLIQEMTVLLIFLIMTLLLKKLKN